MDTHLIKNVINKRKNQIKLFFVSVIFIVILILISTVFINWLSIVLILLLLIILSPLAIELINEYKELTNLENKLNLDLIRFKEIVDSEVNDLHNIINNQTSQTNSFQTHVSPQRVNLTKQRKVNVAARNNAKNLRKKYLLYKEMQELVTPIVDQLQKDPFKI